MTKTIEFIFYHQTVVQGGDERSTNIIMYFFTLARAHDC